MTTTVRYLKREKLAVNTTSLSLGEIKNFFAKVNPRRHGRSHTILSPSPSLFSSKGLMKSRTSEGPGICGSNTDGVTKSYKLPIHDNPSTSSNNFVQIRQIHVRLAGLVFDKKKKNSSSLLNRFPYSNTGTHDLPTSNDHKELVPANFYKRESTYASWLPHFAVKGSFGCRTELTKKENDRNETQVQVAQPPANISSVNVPRRQTLVSVTP